MPVRSARSWRRSAWAGWVGQLVCGWLVDRIGTPALYLIDAAACAAFALVALAFIAPERRPPASLEKTSYRQALSDRRLVLLLVSSVVTLTAFMGAHTTAEFGLAAAACAPGEIAWFVVAADIVHRIAPPAHGGRYHGIWGMALAVAAVAAPLLASYSLGHGGQSLVAIATLMVGLTGAAVCLPLARVVRSYTK